MDKLIRNKKTMIRDEKWHTQDLLTRSSGTLFRLCKNSPNSPQAKRVFRVLELLAGMRDSGHSTEDMSVVLNHHLRRYKWQNLLTLDLMPYLCPEPDVLGYDFEEYYAVRAILDLAATKDGLSRIRNCPECYGVFLAVNRADQKFCGVACKQKNFYSSPEKRKQQRERMRQRYKPKSKDSGIGLRVTERKKKAENIDILAG